MNNICIRCQEALTIQNKSDEHIILDSLGGRLRSYHVLCVSCNTAWGETFDAELANQIPLATLLNIPLHRREPRKIYLQSNSGEEVYVDKNLKATLAKPKIDIGKSYEYSTDKEAKKALVSLSSKYPDKKIQRSEVFRTWTEPFSPQYDLIQGSAFKSIIKTAAEFFVCQNGNLSDIEYVCWFLNRPSQPNNLIRYHYNEKFDKYLQEKEISHTIVCDADPEKRIALCYIELFAVHCFLVVLNYNYHGPTIKATYSYDLLNQSELAKSIEIDLSKEDVASLHFPGDEATEKAFFVRLKRAYAIRGVKMSTSKRTQPKPMG